MQIQWIHETFESGLATWTTSFRGYDVKITRIPGTADGVLELHVAAGATEPLLDVTKEILPGDAMIETLKAVNGYWDLMENGPVEYQTIDTSDMQRHDDNPDAAENI